jgi:threonine dehydrogenase-like Zn-dependent dehydrogenase
LRNALGEKLMDGLPKEGRAVTLDATTGKVEMRKLPVVPPRPGQILVRVRRANICGSDLHMVRGEAFASYKPHYPFILGHEMVGEILALGDGVSRDSRGGRLSEGDRITYAYHRGCGGCPVCSNGQAHTCLQALTSVLQDCTKAPHFAGAFADYYMIKEGQAVVKVPDHVSDALAAGCNCALAQVIHGLDTVGVSMGDQVVIQGAGGLGLYATAVAKARGAKQVIVIDRHDSRLELAKAFGADRVISLSQTPERRNRVMQVIQATGGGAQVVVEVVGRAEALREGQRMLQRGGRYLVMGCIVPKDTFTADPSIWVGSNLSLHAVSLYPTQALLNAIDFVSAHADTLPLEAMVAETYPLEEFEAALQAADALGKSPTAARVALQIA